MQAGRDVFKRQLHRRWSEAYSWTGAATCQPMPPPCCAPAQSSACHGSWMRSSAPPGLSLLSFPAVLRAGLAVRAVGVVDGMNAIAGGEGVPFSTLVDRSRVVCRTTASLCLGVTPRGEGRPGQAHRTWLPQELRALCHQHAPVLPRQRPRHLTAMPGTCAPLRAMQTSPTSAGAPRVRTPLTWRGRSWWATGVAAAPSAWPSHAPCPSCS